MLITLGIVTCWSTITLIVIKAIVIFIAMTKHICKFLTEDLPYSGDKSFHKLAFPRFSRGKIFMNRHGL